MCALLRQTQHPAHSLAVANAVDDVVRLFGQDAARWVPVEAGLKYTLGRFQGS